jgi:hypothetical protein
MPCFCFPHNGWDRVGILSFLLESLSSRLIRSVLVQEVLQFLIKLVKFGPQSSRLWVVPFVKTFKIPNIILRLCT